MKELCTCYPSLLPTRLPNGTMYWTTDVCEDERLQPFEKVDLNLAMGVSECPELEAELDSDDPYTDTSIMNPGSGKRSVKDRRRGTSYRQHHHKSTSRLQRRFEGKLGKSRDPAQSASELCNSKGGTGPNFYSPHEKKFCDVAKRMLYPLCQRWDDMECFDE